MHEMRLGVDINSQHVFKVFLSMVFKLLNSHYTYIVYQDRNFILCKFFPQSAVELFWIHI